MHSCQDILLQRTAAIFMKQFFIWLSEQAGRRRNFSIDLHCNLLRTVSKGKNVAMAMTPPCEVPLLNINLHFIKYVIIRSLRCVYSR